jgi:hypothetical protein
MVEYWWVAVAAVLLVATLIRYWSPWRWGPRAVRFCDARRGFHHQRERLEAKFVQLGTSSSRQDSPRWIDCDFDDDVTYARNRTTGELSAFVAVTVELEPADGQPLPAGGTLGNLRTATAVFRFDHNHWETDGRAIFNLSPAEAIRHYHRELEMIGQEASG